MPVHTQRLEAGLIYTAWQGVVTIEELYQANDHANTLLDQNSDTLYVSIQDMTQLTRPPVNFNQMSQIARHEKERGLVAYVAFGAPRFVQTLGRTLAMLAPQRYIWVDSYEQALTEARHLLAVAHRSPTE